MIDMQAIYHFRDQIVELFHPQKIILFGSYAYGTPTPDSDVDMLVVLPFDGRCARKAAEILIATDPHFAVDLMARTPEQIRERVTLGDVFLREITEKGKVIYEAYYA